MAIKPILFNTEMVRAIPDGRKTCTRRLVKPQPDEKHTYPLGFVTDSTERKEVGCFGFGIDEYGGSIQYAKPPYHTGDILYVRETWQYLYELDGNEQIIEGTGKYYYAATDTIPFDTYIDASGVTHERVPWHPSIRMPKEAARIWLKVTDVRGSGCRRLHHKGHGKRERDALACTLYQIAQEIKPLLLRFGTAPSRNPTLTATVGKRIRGCGLSSLNGARKRRTNESSDNA